MRRSQSGKEIGEGFLRQRSPSGPGLEEAERQVPETERSSCGWNWGVGRGKQSEETGEWRGQIAVGLGSQIHLEGLG